MSLFDNTGASSDIIRDGFMTYYTEQEQETPATLVPTGSPMRKKVKETLPASVDELRRELSEMKVSLQQQQQCAARTATRVAELEDQLVRTTPARQRT